MITESRKDMLVISISVDIIMCFFIPINKWSFPTSS